MDGALTIGEPGTENILWKTPQQMGAERLAREIAEMTRKYSDEEWAKRRERIKQHGQPNPL